MTLVPLCQANNFFSLDFQAYTLMEQFCSCPKQGTDKLIKDCFPFFKIPPMPGEPDIDFQLWNHEINCHTDKIRRRWIDGYQKTYCKNHPDDSKSCHAEKQDFCDLYKINNLPEYDKKVFHTRRICEKLPTAVKKIKEFYSANADLCEKILKEEL